MSAVEISQQQHFEKTAPNLRTIKNFDFPMITGCTKTPVFRSRIEISSKQKKSERKSTSMQIYIVIHDNFLFARYKNLIEES